MCIIMKVIMPQQRSHGGRDHPCSVLKDIHRCNLHLQLTVLLTTGVGGSLSLPAKSCGNNGYGSII